MHLFYGSFNDNVANLFEFELVHAYKVLRLKEKDQILITDGEGNLAECKIISINKKECLCSIIKTKNQPKTNFLHIAIAPTKSNDRFEFFLEKAVEIGISTITPLLTNNSERKKINLERYKKILIAGMKQSRNLYLPTLNPLTKFNDFIIDKINTNQKFIAHCIDSPNKKTLKKTNSSLETVILIGPEGDFSPNEINFALENDFSPLTLGNSRLRTETAGIVATTIYNNL